jgi:hypothetical protein
MDRSGLGRSLQVESAGDGVGRARERNHEAVALALLQRTNAIVSPDRIGHSRVDSSDGCRHLGFSRLPQLRRPFDVRQQKRDCASR